MTRRIALAAGLALALAGCASDGTPSPALAVARLAQAEVLSRRAAPGGEAAPAITRAQLAQYDTPMIMAEIPSAGLTAFVVPFARNGAVETWSTIDDRTIAFRGGIMVATRGFGPDILQSDAPEIARIASGTGTFRRSYYFTDGADQTRRFEYLCTLADRGMTTVTVVERQHTVRHVTESCSGNGVDFVNDYWFEGGGFLRKSRQLLTPEWGHVVLSRVVDNARNIGLP